MVCWNESYSEGSILGPLLFIIFINDLPDSISYAIPLVFADDTKCIKPISSIQDSFSLQKDLDALNNWSLHWKLAFNNSKCQYLRISPQNQIISSANYTINNCPISMSTLHRDLGILVSNDLS